MKTRTGWLGWMLLTTALLLGSGCLRTRIVVRVKPDGSGDILVTRTFSREVVAMVDMQMKQMREMGGMGGMGAVMPEDPFFNEASLRSEAALYGKDVEFVGARKVDRAGSRGALIHYSFKDIRKVALTEDAFGMESMGRMFVFDAGSIETPDADPDESFTFDFKSGDSAVLTVRVPAYPELEPLDGDGKKELEEMGRTMGPGALAQFGGADNPFGLTGKETPLEMASMTMKDMGMELLVEVVGTPSKTNARFREPDRPNRFALFSVSMENALQADKPEHFLARMMTDGPDDMLPFLSLMKAAPNNRVETNRVVTIEFK